MLDVFTRVVGWPIVDNLPSELVVDGLDMAHRAIRETRRALRRSILTTARFII
jgi:hypothetical protein